MAERGRWTKERIEELADRMGTRVKLARAVGTGRDQVSRWISGVYKPSAIAEKALDRVEEELNRRTEEAIG